MNTPLLGLLPLVLLPALWFGILQWLSVVGGWRALARRFAAPRDLPASTRTLTFQSARIGLVSYRNALTVAVLPDGLRLSTFVLMRPGHPPLLIPWSAFGNGQARSMLWYKGVRFEVGPDRVRVELPQPGLEGSPLAAPFVPAPAGLVR